MAYLLTLQAPTRQINRMPISESIVEMENNKSVAASIDFDLSFALVQFANKHRTQTTVSSAVAGDYGLMDSGYWPRFSTLCPSSADGAGPQPWSENNSISCCVCGGELENKPINFGVEKVNW